MTTPANQLPAFIGVGPAYPLQLDNTNSRILINSGDAVIKASITVILNTDITERPFTTKNGIPFGTRIKRMMFDSADTAITVAQYEVPRALGVWEPRIIVDSVDASLVPQFRGGAAIVVDIGFRYRATNTPDNIVIPFQFTAPS